MNHEALVAEGNRLAETLTIISRMILDPETIPEQKEIIKANGMSKKDRLDRCTDALDWDCNCNHSKGHHTSGRGKCHAAGCKCEEWEVEL